MRLSFRFRLIPLLATLIVVGIGVALGQWQLRRAAEKTAIGQRMSERVSAPAVALDGANKLGAAALEYRRVNLLGEFVPAWPLYLDNRPYHGVAGVLVVMPFRLANSSRHVLVQRGWIARDGNQRTRLPVISTPAGEIRISGEVRQHAGRVLQLGQAAPLKPGDFVQNLDAGQFSLASGLQLEDFVIEQSSTVADGLVRDWPSPSTGVERHYGYAFQWFALAATAFFFYVVTGFRRGLKQPGNDQSKP